MRVVRLLDIVVFLMIAVAILLPRPDVLVKPALELGPVEKARVAELQASLIAQPGDPELSLALADLLLDGRKPDWALAALTPALRAVPTDHRLHGRRGLALAEHFEARPAYEAVGRALELCQAGTSAAPCGEADLVRLGFLRASLDQIKDIDLRTDPNAAKERLLRSMRPAALPPRRARKPPLDGKGKQAPGGEAPTQAGSQDTRNPGTP
jgi:hypothetical protein